MARPKAIHKLLEEVDLTPTYRRKPRGNGAPAEVPAPVAPVRDASPADEGPGPPIGPSRSSIDDEINAIARCADALSALDPDARRRVWAYLSDRFSVSIPGGVR